MFFGAKRRILRGSPSMLNTDVATGFQQFSRQNHKVAQKFAYRNVEYQQFSGVGPQTPRRGWEGASGGGVEKAGEAWEGKGGWRGGPGGEAGRRMGYFNCAAIAHC